MPDKPGLRSHPERRFTALAEALLVTLIWSSTFVIVKIGLDSLGPLTIAGLRYTLGFVVLVPFLVLKRGSQKPIGRELWLRLVLIGISSYTVGNGALFWGLKYLPATTGSLLMSLIPLLVLFGGAIFLQEKPRGWQIFGVLLSLAGSMIFFSGGLGPGEPLGLAIMGLGLMGFLSFSLLGRSIARGDSLDTLRLTALPLIIGGLVTLILALLVEGIPEFSGRSISIVLWLAVVNTALGYWIYNRALRYLTALEMNMIMNLSPFFTALLSWLVLGEGLVGKEILGLAITISGVVLVQLGKGPQTIRPGKMGGA